MKLELILSTESKVLSTNIKTFEQQAEQYLATLNDTFETDDDFAKAKEEVKTLEALEKRTRTAIDNVLNGNKDVAELIETATNIAERFREARLRREKLVKAKETEVKQGIIQQAFDSIMAIRQGYESDISLALERNLPKSKIRQRLEEATKRRSTLATLTQAVNAAAESIKAELATESARLSARRKLIPISHEYLFKDTIALIAGEDDLAEIVRQRIAEEAQREAEIQAKAEQAAKQKAEAEKVQAQAIADEMPPQAVNSPQNSATPANEPLADFVITVRLTQITQTNAIEIARGLKTRFGEGVSLNKAK